MLEIFRPDMRVFGTGIGRVMHRGLIGATHFFPVLLPAP
jgi:hypothetical protein